MKISFKQGDTSKFSFNGRLLSVQLPWRVGVDRQSITWLGLWSSWVILSLTILRSRDSMPLVIPFLLLGLTAGVISLMHLYRANILLRQSEERYALALRGSNEGLWDWNLETDTIYFSPRWKEILGCDEASIGDRPQEWFDRVHPDDVEPLKLAIAAHLEGTTAHFEQEHRIQHRDGMYRWVLSRGMAVRNQEGKAYRMAGSQTDISKRKQAEEQLRRIALYDGLTELPNRTFFLDCLKQAIAHHQENPLFSYAVLLLDLDRFQVVNSSLGSTVGDQLLVAITHRIRAFLPLEATLARSGGDEFAILLRHMERISDVTRLADQIQQLLALSFNLDGHEVFITISIGIVLSASHYSQPEHLMRDADTAMYRAKALGKARYQVFDNTMHIRMVTRLRLENDLRRAISQEQHYTLLCDDGELQELQLYYQPIVQLTTGAIAGFEALVRWQHPEQGFLSPAKFIPMAEETGLIIPFGWWILHQACRQMNIWQAKLSANAPLTMNVNLASKQFSLPDLTEQVQYILEETGMDISHLKLEITESTLMDNAKSVIATLYQLRSLRIQLAIDDFGTGYSSLSYLRRFPINTIKIDRSFISRMSSDSNNAEIVRTIIALAHNLSMDVTAEGVETADQFAQLLAMGCECGQGYFFSKPLDAEAATKLLEGTNSTFSG